MSLRVVDITLPTTRARSLGAAPGTPGPAPVNSTKYPISRADTPGFSFVRHPLPLALIFPLLRLGKQSWRTRRLRTCLWAASPRERARVVVKRVLFFDEEGTEDVVGADEDGGVILVVETLRILASMIRRPRERRTKKWSGGDAPEVVAPKHDRQSGTMDPHTRRDRRRRRRHQDPQNLPRRDCRRSRPRERRDARPD